MPLPMTFSTKRSNFNATLIYASYLGAADKPSFVKDPVIDDYDAISVIGVNNNEWNIKNILHLIYYKLRIFYWQKNRNWNSG